MHTLTAGACLVLAVVVLVNAGNKPVNVGNKPIKFKGLMDDLVQKPIFYSGEMRRIDRVDGDPCQFSNDCRNGCCLMKENDGRRRCCRKSKKDEFCSISQVKLDLYMEHCPCERGNKYCSDDPQPKCLD